MFHVLLFQLTAVMNPGCSGAPYCLSLTRDKKVNVLYVKADSDRDRIHYLWSFYGKPSFLMALGDLNSTLTIDWPNFTGFTNETDKSAVTIVPEPHYATISVVNQVSVCVYVYFLLWCC